MGNIKIITMKFVTSLKFLVLLMGALSVFTKKITRSTTATKVGTKLDSMAYTYGYCWNAGGALFIDSMGVDIKTSTANSGKSGFVIRNYKSSKVFNCDGLLRLPEDSGRASFFVAYRKFSAYQGPYKKENGWTSMRQLILPMVNGGQLLFNIDKHLFSDTINKSELTNMESNISTNSVNYMTKYKKYVGEMIDRKVRAQNLKAIQSANITAREGLNAEIAKKQIAMTTTRSTLQNLKATTEATSVQIRNYEKELNIKRTDVMDPAMQALKEALQNLDALVAQKADNDKKIQGIVPIDSDDLGKSNLELAARLRALQKQYMSEDPKSTEFSTLIAHLETQMDTIPTVIA